MTITVNGKDFANHEVSTINDRPYLVIPLGPAAATIVNDTVYSEYEYSVKDGKATLRIPMGETFPFQLSLGVSDELVSRLGRLLGEIDDHRVVREPVLAPVVDIAFARGRNRPTKSRTPGPDRTHFTPCPIG